ncbi:MAG TPA: hypothetical protein VGM37_01880 [Armatimonadota bacterium]|jgi:hypothetical protein
MTSALRVTATVLPGHKVEVHAPEFAVGDTVEVTIQPREGAAEPAKSALDILEEIHKRNLPPIIGDADAYIRAERDSWGD